MWPFVLAGVSVLGLALVGFVTVVGALFGERRRPRGPEALSDPEKLAIAHEILTRFFGGRAPPELMRELAMLRGLPLRPLPPASGGVPAPAEAPPSSGGLASLVL